MALIKTSGLISDIIGKIRGTTFQHTQGGLTMRITTATRNKNSVSQQSNKIGINSILKSWTSLTQSQRDVWHQYALYRNIKQKKNQNRTISGQHIFIRENSFRYNMTGYGAMYDNPIHETPIFASPPEPITVVNIIMGFGPKIYNINRSILSEEEGLVLSVSRPIHESMQSRYTAINIMKANTLSGPTHVFPSTYVTQYGRYPAIGQSLLVQLSVYNVLSETYTTSPRQLIKVE